MTKEIQKKIKNSILVGGRIEHIRKNLGLSIEHVAEQIGLKRNAYRRTETGETSINLIEVMSFYYHKHDVNMNYLLGGEEPVFRLEADANQSYILNDPSTVYKSKSPTELFIEKLQTQIHYLQVSLKDKEEIIKTLKKDLDQ